MLAIYVRVSSEKQADRLSMDEQTAAGKAFAALKNQLYSIYVDIKSAKNIIDRDDFVLLLKDIDLGKIDAIWVGDIDRLTRSMEDGGRLKKMIDNHSLIIYDRGKEISSLEFALRVVLADEERQKIIARTTRNRRSQIDDGENRYPSIYGYKAEIIGQKKNGVALRKWIVDEEEANMVRFIYQLYFKDLGFDDICAELIQAGYKTKSGGNWDRGTIHNILRRPEYVGITHDTKGNPIPSKVYKTHIIDRETWDKVQSSIDAKIRNRRGKYFKDASYDCSGVIKCKKCGAPYFHHRVMSHGKILRQDYMHKAIDYLHRECKQAPKNIKRDTIDYILRSLFVLTFGDYSRVKGFIDLQKKELEIENQDLDQNQSRILRNITQYEDQKRRLIDGVKKGVFEPDEVRESLTEIRIKIEAEQNNLAISQEKINMKILNLDALMRTFAETTIEDYLEANEKKRRVLNMQYIESATLDGFILNVKYIIDIEYKIDLRNLASPDGLLLTMCELKIATEQGSLVDYCQTLRVFREHAEKDNIHKRRTMSDAIHNLQSSALKSITDEDYLAMMQNFYILPSNRNIARVTV